jgi:hypothetical protein
MSKEFQISKSLLMFDGKVLIGGNARSDLEQPVRQAYCEHVFEKQERERKSRDRGRAELMICFFLLPGLVPSVEQ